MLNDAPPGPAMVSCNVPASEHYWSDTDGCRMRYLSAGRSSRLPPLLLIHGLMAYSFSWRFNMGALGQRRRVFAVDLPGVGFSDRCLNVDSSMKGLAMTLSLFLKAKGIKVFDLVGTSHGGGVAIMLAALHSRNPERPHVRRLVLSAPVNPWSSHGLLMTKFLATAPGRTLFRRFEPFIRPIDMHVLRRMYGKPARISPGTLEGYRKALRIEGTVDQLLNMVQHWHRDLRRLRRALPEIRSIPTLLIWGSRDRLVLPESALELKARLPHSELAMLPEVGHLPYEEVPEVFNRLVTGFLDESGN